MGRSRQADDAERAAPPFAQDVQGVANEKASQVRPPGERQRTPQPTGRVGAAPVRRRQTPKSVAAFANLKKLCEEHLPGSYKIEVVDLLEHPQLAAGDQIVAIPTLVRKLPEPLAGSSATCRTPSARWWVCNCGPAESVTSEKTDRCR